MNNTKIAIFEGKFNGYYYVDDNGIHTVFLGNYKPEEILTAVNGKHYFLIDSERLLARKSGQTGKTYYKILNK